MLCDVVFLGQKKGFLKIFYVFRFYKLGLFATVPGSVLKKAFIYSVACLYLYCTTVVHKAQISQMNISDLEF